MDRGTLDYYDRHAAEILATYRSIPSSIDSHIPEAFPQPKSTILDVGSGSDRDLVGLLAKGYDGYGLEPSEGLRAESVRAFPQLQNRVFPFSLPLPENAACGSPYDGIVCSAVLMHSRIRGTECSVWAAEFGDIRFELQEQVCEGCKQCVLRFSHEVVRVVETSEAPHRLTSRYPLRPQSTGPSFLTRRIARPVSFFSQNHYRNFLQSRHPQAYKSNTTPFTGPLPDPNVSRLRKAKS
ncbi:MAG: class I SAM-dependent methyltransferase [Verrucomicrobiia bacterium]